MAGYDIRLLRGMSVRFAGERRSVCRGGLRLVAYLALVDRTVVRDVVAGTLWEEVGADRAAAALRSTLWRVGQAAPELIEADRETVGLAPDVVVDLTSARERARRIIADEQIALTTSARAFEGELLPDLDAVWAAPEREHYRQLRLHALEAIARAHMVRESWAGAVDAASTVIAVDPLRESAHRLLIEAHVGIGNLVDAYRAYDAYRTLLRDELGLEPSARIEQLVADVPAATPAHVARDRRSA